VGTSLAVPDFGGFPVRIAFVHSFYVSRNPSGENRVVEAEIRALRAAGHDVMLAGVRTDDLEGEPLYAARSAIRVATGAGRSPSAALERFRPDVIHVHNLFPNFGTRWATSAPAPIVVTLHNFRPLCANGALFRDGHVCTLCPDGRTSLPGLRHACYRDSRAATLPIAIDDRVGLGLRPLLATARKVVVLSDVARTFYLRAGLRDDQVVVAPNFLDASTDPGYAPEGEVGDHWLYVGRLGPEKGIEPLIRAWPRDRRLVVVGDGPEREAVRAAAAGKRIELLGLRDREAVIGLMRGARGLVFPSRCYENFPLVYAEAMAVGLPVLAWEPNVVASMVRAEGTGLATTWDEDLTTTLDRAESRFGQLRARCRERFEATMSEAAYVRRAERLYAEVTGVAQPTPRPAGARSPARGDGRVAVDG
jgi:glycosyltransferase involved in cell wall biosynthesis